MFHENNEKYKESNTLVTSYILTQILLLQGTAKKCEILGTHIRVKGRAVA